MGLESVNKMELSFFYITLFPAAIIFIYLLYIFSYVFTGVDITDVFPLLENKYHFLVLLAVSAYIVSMAVHGIRYVGFMGYKKLYEKGIKNLFTRMIFRLFRHGTVVEECLYQFRNEKCTLEWINNLKNEKCDKIKTMWRLAAGISKDQQIYQFYFYSEIFQCCDTTFLFMIITQCIFLIYMLITKTGGQIIVSIVLTLIFILAKYISKTIGISFANRFLFEIDIKGNIIKSN